jgi:multiple sugar transport system permease protein
MSPRRVARAFILNVAAVVLIIFVAGPFVWVILASLQGENDLLKRPPSVFQRPTFDNYNYVFTGKIPTSYAVKGQLRSRITQEARLIAPALANSFIVALAVMAINIVLGTPAAYTFSRLRFRARGAAYNFILGSRLMPAMAVAIPYYVIVQALGLLDTKISLVLVDCALTLPFTIWFLTLYINNVPRDMEEAARVDGCTTPQALLRIVVPMMLPGLVATAAFAFMSSYNEFLFARFLTQSLRSQTGPVVIASIAGNPDASYSLISVCMTLGLVPPLILAIVLRKRLTEGLSTSVTFR